MAMPNIPVREHAAAVAAVYQFLRGRGEDIPSKLTAVGVVAGVAAVSAAASSPAAGWVALGPSVWSGALAGTFFGGLLAIWAGLWVEADVPRRAAAGQILLCLALVLLLVAVNLISDAYDPAVVFSLVLGAMI